MYELDATMPIDAAPPHSARAGTGVNESRSMHVTALCNERPTCCATPTAGCVSATTERVAHHSMVGRWGARADFLFYCSLCFSG